MHERAHWEENQLTRLSQVGQILQVYLRDAMTPKDRMVKKSGQPCGIGSKAVDLRSVFALAQEREVVILRRELAAERKDEDES